MNDMKLTIWKKMWLGFSAVISLVVFVSVANVWGLIGITSQYKDIIEQDMKKVELAKQLQNVQKETGTLILEYIMFAKEEVLGKIDNKHEERADVANQLSILVTDEQSQQLLQQLEEKTVLLFESNDMVLSLKKSGGDFRPYSVKSNGINNEILAHLEELITLQEQHSKQTMEALATKQTRTIQIIIGLVICSVLFGLVIAYQMSRHIAKPVQMVTAGLKEIARGNLQASSVTVRNNDEIGEMAATYNAMLQDLHMIVSNVRESSVSLTEQATQLSTNAAESLQASQTIMTDATAQKNMSQQQEEFVHGTAKTMYALRDHIEQITATNEDMLQSTRHVEQFMVKGTDAVGEVSSQMATIHDTFEQTIARMEKMISYSHEIEKVTTMIASISEQTNLLALNATIEAARAGESGKGFAVVADEVRKLAEQSKRSTEEITQIIQLIQHASTEAAQAVNTGGAQVTIGLTKTTESMQLFNEMQQTIQVMAQQVSAVNESVQHAQQMTQQVVTNTTNVQQLAEHVFNRAVTSSEAIKTQVNINEQITSNVRNVEQLACRLNEDVHRFTV